MGVKADKDEIENYAAEVDEGETGKFTILQFATVAARFMIEDDLDNIVEEVDEDGSGTLDFDEFQEMMMG